MHSMFLLTVLMTFTVVEDQSEPSVTLSQAEYAAKLHEINSKRQLALRDLDNLPNRIGPATDKIVKELEEFALGEEIKKEFEQHYAAVEKVVAGVGIREERSTPKTYFAMLQSPLRDGPLQEICKEFAEDVQASLKKEHERFTDVLTRRLNEKTDIAYDNARKELRNQCDQVIAKYFPVWSERTIPSRELKPRNPMSNGPLAPGGGAAGLAGVLILIFRKTLQKIVRKIFVKIGGKVLAKLIPVIGLLLLLLEARDFVKAKADLELQMRQAFMDEYKAEFIPVVVWNEAKAETRKSIEEDLRKWGEECKDKATQVLSAAEMLEAPGIKQWLDSRTKKGLSFEIVLKEMIGVCEVFDKLALQYEPDLLIDMRVQAPDKAELRELTQQLGSRVVEEYKKYGIDYLKAANHMGIPLFLEVLNDPKLTWKTAYDALKSLPRDSEKVEKNGVLNGLRAGVDPGSFNSDQRKEVGRVSPKDVETLSHTCKDPDNLRKLLIEPDHRRIAAALIQDNPDLAAAWLTHRPYNDLQELEDDRRRKTLVDLYSYRREHNNESAKAFVDRVTPWEIGTWQKFGKDGIEISYVYLDRDSAPGQHQEKLARQAVKLYEDGVDKAALKRPELLSIADWASVIPIVGVPTFNILYPLLPATKWAVAIIAIFVPLVAFVICVCLVWWLIRKFRASPSPEPSQSTIATGHSLKPVEPIQVKVTVAPEPTTIPALAPRESVPLLGDGKDE